MADPQGDITTSATAAAVIAHFDGQHADLVVSDGAPDGVPILARGFICCAALLRPPVGVQGLCQCAAWLAVGCARKGICMTVPRWLTGAFCRC